MILWDDFIAASIAIAIDEPIALRLTNLQPQCFDREVPTAIEQTIGLQHHHFFGIAKKLSMFIEDTELLVHLFLGYVPTPMSIWNE